MSRQHPNSSVNPAKSGLSTAVWLVIQCLRFLHSWRFKTEPQESRFRGNDDGWMDGWWYRGNVET